MRSTRSLVNGASGAVGSAAVQLAHNLGAHVTGVCGPTNVDLVRSLGADPVKELAEGGAIRPVIDRCSPWEAIAEVHRRVETGHKRGHAIVDLGPRTASCR